MEGVGTGRIAGGRLIWQAAKEGEGEAEGREEGRGRRGRIRERGKRGEVTCKN
jgi:hypothetical protein